MYKIYGCSCCYIYLIMPRLSTYSNFDYPDGEERIMPWEFWTDEERSLVIREGYKDLIINSKQVKPYLDASRLHFYTQWLVPLTAAALCFGPFRGSLLANVYKKSPLLGYKCMSSSIQTAQPSPAVSLSLGSTSVPSTSRRKTSKYAPSPTCGTRSE